MKTTCASFLLLTIICAAIYIIGDWMQLRRIRLPEWLVGLILVGGILTWAFIHIRAQEETGRRMMEQHEKESRQERELLRAQYEVRDLRKQLEGANRKSNDAPAKPKP